MQAVPIDGTTPRGRGGRPSAKDAGDVDRRILDAAANLFLRLGFDATSCDQVVAEAGAGKASLYARYANKEALFAAVVRDKTDRLPTPTADVPKDIPLPARLQAVGHRMMTDALRPEVVALMRVLLSTAHRMPHLAHLVDRLGRENAVQQVAATIAGVAMDSVVEMNRALVVAKIFVDFTLVPLQMRALLGDDAVELAAETDRKICDIIDLLAKGGMLNGWE